MFKKNPRHALRFCGTWHMNYQAGLESAVSIAVTLKLALMVTSQHSVLIFQFKNYIYSRQTGNYPHLAPASNSSATIKKSKKKSAVHDVLLEGMKMLTEQDMYHRWLQRRIWRWN